MPKPAPRSPYREDADVPRTLSDRVRHRVEAAESKLGDLAVARDVDGSTLALWLVFDEFGDARRAQRRRTGEPVVPALREATRAFRRGPSLDSLVAVAALLEERGLPTTQ